MGKGPRCISFEKEIPLPRVYSWTVYVKQMSKGFCFRFREGSKFKKYGATSNIILRNGVSLAAGLNGDLQLWDIATGEYEGNLYHDPNVKDKSNPGTHHQWSGIQEPMTMLIIMRGGEMPEVEG